MNYFLNPSKAEVQFLTAETCIVMTIFMYHTTYCRYHHTVLELIGGEEDDFEFLHIRNFKFPLWLKYICCYYRVNLFACLSVTVYRIDGVYGILFMSKIVFGDIISKLQLLNIVVSES